MTMFAADLPSLWLNDHKHAMCQGACGPATAGPQADQVPLQDEAAASRRVDVSGVVAGAFVIVAIQSDHEVAAA